MEANHPVATRLHIDWPLLVALSLLATLGMLVLYSAGGQSNELLTKQAIRVSVAFTVMLVLAQISPRRYFEWAPWLYAVSILLLIAVLFFGQVGGGAQRWIGIGGFNFQPSELVKITVPLMVAYYLAGHSLPPSFYRVLAAGVVVAVPVLLVARQPDLGTSLLIGSSGAFALFLSGLPWRLVIGLGVAAAAAAPLVWLFMRDYQRQRVLTFLDPEQDPLGAGYHIIQSKIAIGSGGVYGKGWLNGTQSQLDFIPERATDFVFAVFSEEFGLLGVLSLLALYLFIVLRGLHLANQAQEVFGRLLAGSLVLTFFIYVFVNIGMVSGLLPVVGLPLPLLSYGGTSLVTMMAAFGIVMAMYSHRRLLSH